MKLIIARHGQASFQAASDFERPLTELGKQQTETLVQENLPTLSGVEALWCSTLLRAKETAVIFESHLKLDKIEKPFLSPDGDVAKVLREIRKSGLDSLLIVSHQPLVGELVSMLLEGNPYQAHPFTTSEVVVLDMDMVEAGLATLVQDLIPL